MAMARNKPMVENTLALIGNPTALVGAPLGNGTSGNRTSGNRSFKNRKPGRFDRIASHPHGKGTPTTTRPSVAVLVAGGFHTAPLTQLLRAKGISYLVITPNVENLSERDHDLYVKRLNGELLTPEDVFGQAQTNLAAKAKDPLAPASALASGLFAGTLATAFTAAVLVYMNGAHPLDALSQFQAMVSHLPTLAQAQASGAVAQILKAAQAHAGASWTVASTAVGLIGMATIGTVPLGVQQADVRKKAEALLAKPVTEITVDEAGKLVELLAIGRNGEAVLGEWQKTNSVLFERALDVLIAAYGYGVDVPSSTGDGMHTDYPLARLVDDIARLYLWDPSFVGKEKRDSRIQAIKARLTAGLDISKGIEDRHLIASRFQTGAARVASTLGQQGITSGESSNPLFSREFKAIAFSESFRGTAKAAVNGFISADGKEIVFGNPQHFATDIQDKIKTGQLHGFTIVQEQTPEGKAPLRFYLHKSIVDAPLPEIAADRIDAWIRDANTRPAAQPPEGNDSGRIGKGVIKPLKKLFMPFLKQIRGGEALYDNVIGPVLEEILFTGVPLLLFHGAIPALLLFRAAFIALHLFGSQAPPGEKPLTVWEKIAIPTAVSIFSIAFGYFLPPSLATTLSARVIAVLPATILSANQHSWLNLATPVLNALYGVRLQKAVLRPGSNEIKSIWERSSFSFDDFEDRGAATWNGIPLSKDILRIKRDKLTGEDFVLFNQALSPAYLSLLGKADDTTLRTRIISIGDEKYVIFKMSDNFNADPLNGAFLKPPAIFNALEINAILKKYKVDEPNFKTFDPALLKTYLKTPESKVVFPSQIPDIKLDFKSVFSAVGKTKKLIRRSSTLHDTKPPKNGMDVSQAYRVDAQVPSEMMDTLDMNRWLRQETDRLVREYPEASADLKAMRVRLESYIGSNDYDNLAVVARLMAAVIDKIRKEQPDRYILHFARDLGYNLVTQEALDRLEDKTTTRGGAFYLNRPMMGSVYNDLHQVVGSVHSGAIEPLVETWFDERMKQGDPAFIQLAEATRDSLQAMGVFDQESVLLMDTGFVATMPWYVYGVMRYYDRQAGRPRRDIDVLLVKSNNATRQLSGKDLRDDDAALFAGGQAFNMMHQHMTMLGILEATGDERAHPVRFDAVNRLIISESPVHQLQFRLLRQVFLNMALAQHLQQQGVEEFRQHGVSAPEIPLFSSSQIGLHSYELSQTFFKNHIEELKLKDTLLSKPFSSSNWDSSKYKIDPELFGKFPTSNWDSSKYKIDPNLFEKLPKDFLKELSPKKSAQWKTANQYQASFKMFPNLILKPLPNLKIERLWLVMMRHAFPKKNPYGLGGILGGGLLAVLAQILQSAGLLSNDQMTDTTAFAVVGALTYIAAAWGYRYFLGKIRAGSFARETTQIALVEGVQRSLAAIRFPSDGIRIEIPDNILEMDSAAFIGLFSPTMTPEERSVATGNFMRGYHYDAANRIAYVNTGLNDHLGGLVPPRVMGDVYVKSALYDSHQKLLLVHKHVAMSPDFQRELVLSHELGKKVFSERFSSLHPFASQLADLIGNLYELAYLIGHPFKTPPATLLKILTSGTLLVIASTINVASHAVSASPFSSPIISPLLGPLLLLPIFALWNKKWMANLNVLSHGTGVSVQPGLRTSVVAALQIVRTKIADWSVAIVLLYFPALIATLAIPDLHEYALPLVGVGLTAALLFAGEAAFALAQTPLQKLVANVLRAGATFSRFYNVLTDPAIFLLQGVAWVASYRPELRLNRDQWRVVALGLAALLLGADPHELSVGLTNIRLFVIRKWHEWHGETVSREDDRTPFGPTAKNIGIDNGVAFSSEEQDRWRGAAAEATISTVMIKDEKVTARFVVDTKLREGTSATYVEDARGLIIVTREPVIDEASQPVSDRAAEIIIHEREEWAAESWLRKSRPPLTQAQIRWQAHVIASAKQRLLFGRDGLTAFDQAELIRLFRLPVQEREKIINESRAEHRRILTAYFGGERSNEMPRIIAYEERFQKALRGSLFDAVFSGTLNGNMIGPAADALRLKADDYNWLVSETIADLSSDPFEKMKKLLSLRDAIPDRRNETLRRLWQMIRHIPDDGAGPVPGETKWDFLIKFYESTPDESFRTDAFVLGEYILALNRTGNWKKAAAVADEALTLYRSKLAKDPKNVELRVAVSELLIGRGTAATVQSRVPGEKDNPLLLQALALYKKAYETDLSYYAASNIVRTLIALGRMDEAKDYAGRARDAALDANYERGFWPAATLLEAALVTGNDGEFHRWMDKVLKSGTEASEIISLRDALERWRRSMIASGANISMNHDTAISLLNDRLTQLTPSPAIAKAMASSRLWMYSFKGAPKLTIEEWLARHTFGVSGLRRGNGIANAGIVADNLFNPADRELVRQLIEALDLLQDDKGKDRTPEEIVKAVHSYLDQAFRLGTNRPAGTRPEFASGNLAKEALDFASSPLERLKSPEHAAQVDDLLNAILALTGAKVNGDRRVSATNISAAIALGAADCRWVAFAEQFIVSEALQQRREVVLRHAYDHLEGGPAFRNSYEKNLEELKELGRYKIVVMQGELYADVQVDAKGEMRTAQEGLHKGRPIVGNGQEKRTEEHTLALLVKMKDNGHAMEVDTIHAIDGWYRSMYKLGFTPATWKAKTLEKDGLVFENAVLVVDAQGNNPQTRSIRLKPMTYSTPRQRDPYNGWPTLFKAYAHPMRVTIQDLLPSAARTARITAFWEQVVEWHKTQVPVQAPIQPPPGHVGIPTPLRQFTDKRDFVPVTGTTVHEALLDLVRKYPELRKWLFTDENKVRPFVSIHLNAQRVSEPLESVVFNPAMDSIEIVPLIAGGSDRANSPSTEHRAWFENLLKRLWVEARADARNLSSYETAESLDWWIFSPTPSESRAAIFKELYEVRDPVLEANRPYGAKGWNSDVFARGVINALLKRGYRLPPPQGEDLVQHDYRKKAIAKVHELATKGYLKRGMLTEVEGQIDVFGRDFYKSINKDFVQAAKTVNESARYPGDFDQQRVATIFEKTMTDRDPWLYQQKWLETNSGTSSTPGKSLLSVIAVVALGALAATFAWAASGVAMPLTAYDLEQARQSLNGQEVYGASGFGILLGMVSQGLFSFSTRKRGAAASTPASLTPAFLHPSVIVNESAEEREIRTLAPIMVARGTPLRDALEQLRQTDSKNVKALEEAAWALDDTLKALERTTPASEILIHTLHHHFGTALAAVLLYTQAAGGSKEEADETIQSMERWATLLSNLESSPLLYHTEGGFRALNLVQMLENALRLFDPLLEDWDDKSLKPLPIYDHLNHTIDFNSTSLIPALQGHDFIFEQLHVLGDGSRIMLAKTTPLLEDSNSNIFIVTVDHNGQVTEVAVPVERPTSRNNNERYTFKVINHSDLRKLVSEKFAVARHQPIPAFKAPEGMFFQRNLITSKEKEAFRLAAFDNPFLRHLLLKLLHLQGSRQGVRLTNIYRISKLHAAGLFALDERLLTWSINEDRNYMNIVVHEIAHAIFNLLRENLTFRKALSQHLSPSQHREFFAYLESKGSFLLEEILRSPRVGWIAMTEIHENESIAFFLDTLEKGDVIVSGSNYHMTYGDLQMLARVDLLPTNLIPLSAIENNPEDVPLPLNFFDSLKRAERPLASVTTMDQITKYGDRTHSARKVADYLHVLLAHRLIDPKLVDAYLDEHSIPFPPGIADQLHAMVIVAGFYGLSASHQQEFDSSVVALIGKLGTVPLNSSLLNSLGQPVFPTTLLKEVFVKAEFEPKAIERIVMPLINELSRITEQPAEKAHRTEKHFYALYHLFSLIGKEKEANVALWKAIAFDRPTREVTPTRSGADDIWSKLNGRSGPTARTGRDGITLRDPLVGTGLILLSGLMEPILRPLVAFIQPAAPLLFEIGLAAFAAWSIWTIGKAVVVAHRQKIHDQKMSLAHANEMVTVGAPLVATPTDGATVQDPYLRPENEQVASAVAENRTLFLRIKDAAVRTAA